MSGTILTGATCPFLGCLVREPHTHPACPDCGAVRYGNMNCGTCASRRSADLNPHDLVTVPADYSREVRHLDGDARNNELSNLEVREAPEGQS